MHEKISVSIGICVYNEEGNIGRLLEALLLQKTEHACISEIFVVSSGSTDRTNEIVESFANNDSRIKLMIQRTREGKASAINLFLKYAKSDVLVLQSGDTVPLEDTIEKLVSPFTDPLVGMTGGHSIPVNDRNTFLGFTVQLQWELLHQLSIENPRFGELIAFRNIITDMPINTNTDEAFIEGKIKEHDLRLVYTADACLYNKGPETIKDFINQRRRIYAGHLHLMKTSNYKVSSLNLTNVLMLIKNVNLTPKEVIFCFLAGFLEVWARSLGTYDLYVKKTNHYKWDMIRTTKELKR
jgi:poly-beta-1,6-N-acetyl-D-glucosamine synthase